MIGVGLLDIKINNDLEGKAQSGYNNYWCNIRKDLIKKLRLSCSSTTILNSRTTVRLSTARGVTGE